MSLIGNILWILLGGFFTFIGYVFGGLVLCLTIVGIPFGIQAFKLGMASLMPFGREVREDPGQGGLMNLIFNVLWLLLFGWEIALNHLVWAAVFAVSIIGIPFAVQHLKLVPLSLFPFGRSFVERP